MSYRQDFIQPYINPFYRYCLVLVLLWFICPTLRAQKVEFLGKITDQTGQPVAFASVWVNELNAGTAANELGDFKINLLPGTYTCSFRQPGFDALTQTITVDGNKVILNVQLKSNETVKSAGDSALFIIKKVIAHRRRYRKSMPPLTGQFYSKALEQLNDAPKMFLKNDLAVKLNLDSNRQGLIGLSEYVASYHSRNTDYIQEEVNGAKMTVDSNAFNFNTATRLHIDFYANNIPLTGVSDHSFLSPVGMDAPAYYKYQVVGSFLDGSEHIDAISVTPRHRDEFLFSGIIYIVEKEWVLYGVDLQAGRGARMDFVNKIGIKQQFVRFKNKQWVIQKSNFNFDGSLLGFKYSGYFLQVYQNMSVDTALNTDPHNEVYHSTRDNYHKDDQFWMQNRPVPLLPQQDRFYEVTELAQRHKKDKTITDSLQNTNNKFLLLNILLKGYTLHDYHHNSSISFPSPYNVFFYNTVEGFGYDFKLKYLKIFDNRHNLTVIPNIRYGYSDKVFNANVFANYIYNPFSQASVYGRVGSDFLDLNNKGTINPFINSLSTLFLGNNYIKLYQSKFILLGTQKEVSNGVLLNGQFEYADRNSLFNTTQHTFNKDSSLLTSNNPLDPYGDTPLFPHYRAFIFRASATFTFDQDYDIIPAGKFILPSLYPRVRLNFRMGIPTLGSNVNYEFISVDVFQDRFNAGIYGFTSYFFSTGFFPNTRSLYYPDYNQFRGGESFFFDATLGSFHFLNYYTYSTDRPYFEAHLEHNFTGIFLSHVPLLEKLNLQEIIGGSFLTQGTLPDYKEVYVGLKRRVIRLDYGLAYGRYTPVKQGFRLSYNF